MKKVRAVLQLVEADDGTRLANCQRQLRVVNRALSQLRDADTTLETLTKIRVRNPRLFSEHTFGYELRLIDACSRTVHRDVAALHRAETLLGDDHNVVVLCA